jgi:tripartite-type tricarboxylate transporter receptor subunit TctC
MTARHAAAAVHRRARGDHARDRRPWIWRTGAAVLSLLCAVVATAQAQTFPTKPIRIIVPFAAGGGSDTVTRIVANRLADRLGQAVTIENRGGAGGNLGMEAGARATADGYTLTVVTQNLVVNPHLYKNLTYKPQRDFRPIALMNRFYQIVIVNPSVPARTLSELIALAKSKPGALTAGNGGIGGTAQMDIDLLCAMAGINIVQVPYRGEAPVMTDVIGGQLNMTISSFVGVDQLIKTGKVRALAVTSAKRAVQFPDIPTVADTVPGYEMDGWYGIAAPAGTPDAVANRLEQEITSIIWEPAITQNLIERGFDPVGASAADFSKTIAADFEKYGKLIRERGIKID